MEKSENGCAPNDTFRMHCRVLRSSCPPFLFVLSLSAISPRFCSLLVNRKMDGGVPSLFSAPSTCRRTNKIRRENEKPGGDKNDDRDGDFLADVILTFFFNDIYY